MTAHVTKKRHHTLPRFYLKRFTSDESESILWKYNKDDFHHHSLSVGDATVVKNFYSVRRTDGTWDDSVEEVLSDLEGKAAPVICDLLENRELSNENREIASYFFAAMLRRVQALGDNFNSAIRNFVSDRERLRAYFEELVPKLSKRHSESEIEKCRKLIDIGNFSENCADFGKGAYLSTWLLNMHQTAGIIFNMHWQILIASQEEFFLTSDAPAYVRRKGNDRDPGVVGIARADLDAELSLPLSTKHFLMARHAGCSPIMTASKTKVRELNARTIRMANRFVFCREESTAIARLVRENSDFKMPLCDLDL